MDTKSKQKIEPEKTEHIFTKWTYHIALQKNEKHEQKPQPLTKRHK